MQYRHIRYRYTKDRLHPEMNKHFRFTRCKCWARPIHELGEIQPALYLSTLVLRLHAPGHALSKPGLQMD